MPQAFIADADVIIYSSFSSESFTVGLIGVADIFYVSTPPLYLGVGLYMIAKKIRY